VLHELVETAAEFYSRNLQRIFGCSAVRLVKRRIYCKERNNLLSWNLVGPQRCVCTTRARGSLELFRRAPSSSKVSTAVSFAHLDLSQLMSNAVYRRFQHRQHRWFLTPKLLNSAEASSDWNRLTKSQTSGSMQCLNPEFRDFSLSIYRVTTNGTRYNFATVQGYMDASWNNAFKTKRRNFEN